MFYEGHGISQPCPRFRTKLERQLHKERGLLAAQVTVGLITLDVVPCICELANGISIYIYYAPKEHPPPHFHAIYGDDEASYDIRSLKVTAGRLRSRQHRAVTEWASTRKRELLACWDLAMSGQQPGKVP
jgi:hypothetical protein